MRKRILDISEQLGLSHIGSNLSAAQVLEEIYKVKTKRDLLVMDEGHAHLAHLVAREKYEGLDNIKRLIAYDIHCNRSVGCEVSTGSLGMGMSVSVGLALADKTRDVYVLTSDGAMAEGVNWEALRFKADNKLDNLKIHVNANGFSAIDPVDIDTLERRIHAFCPDVVVHRTNSNFNKVEGVSAHYAKI